jgi:cytochrome bd-type quinol oxidase subunit 2
MPPFWSRLAFVTEFLVALVAILEVWSETGGQNHLDLMAWYAKLSLTVGLALVTVLGTMAAVSHERAWNAKTIACLLLAVVLAGAMAAATYYVHVHENDDAGDSDDSTVAYLLGHA